MKRPNAYHLWPLANHIPRRHFGPRTVRQRSPSELFYCVPHRASVERRSSRTALSSSAALRSAGSQCSGRLEVHIQSASEEERAATHLYDCTRSVRRQPAAPEHIAQLTSAIRTRYLMQFWVSIERRSAHWTPEEYVACVPQSTCCLHMWRGSRAHRLSDASSERSELPKPTPNACASVVRNPECIVHEVSTESLNHFESSRWSGSA